MSDGASEGDPGRVTDEPGESPLSEMGWTRWTHVEEQTPQHQIAASSGAMAIGTAGFEPATP